MALTVTTINADKIARKSSYKELQGDQLLVYSTFVTIQGEGPFAGRHSLFIRLAGCNFGDKKDRCSWCDTKFFLDSGVVHSTDSLQTKIWDSSTDLVVITGGEPLLQQNIVRVTRELLANNPGLNIQFETNGTQTKAMLDLLELSVNYGGRVTIICSPKASQKSGYVSAPPLPHNTVREFPKNFFYKFVITADVDDVHSTLPQWLFEIQNQVYISPMTVYDRNVNEYEIASSWDPSLVNHERTRLNYKRAGFLAMQHRFMVSTQMHTWLDLE
jgi:organic radical activating enzyme